MHVYVCRESIADIYKTKRTHTHTHTHTYIYTHINIYTRIHRDECSEGAKRLKVRKAKPSHVENGTNETRQRDVVSVNVYDVPFFFFLYLSK